MARRCRPTRRRPRTYDAQELERLLERTAQAIADLEAQNERGDDLAPPRLPPELRKAEQRRKRVLAARREMEEEGPATPT